MRSQRIGRLALAPTALIAVLLGAAGAFASDPSTDPPMGGVGTGCPTYPCKPQRSVVPAGYAQDRIDIRFNLGLKIRLREGRLVDLGGKALDGPDVQAVLQKYGAGKWERLHLVSEEKLDELRATAEKNTGQAMPDLNLAFRLVLPAGASAATAMDDFNGLGIVEMADPVPEPMKPSLPGDYFPDQRYHFSSTDGTNCFGVRLLPGGFGQGAVRICDIEYSWNTAHEDLPGTTLLGPAAVDPFGDNNHGTAVLGEIFGRDNGWGVTGGVPNCPAYLAAANTAGGYNVAAAITNALTVLTFGDVIIIEQQIAGPNYTGVPAGTQFGLVPVEWNRNIYNAIVTAIGTRCHVAQAAGNGSQNLNDAVYSVGNGGHFPFNGSIDSGSIIVGAGGSPASGGDRSRLGFSNFGTRVNLQGWGHNVYTTGYGNAFNAEGVNRWFTSSFSGTSSATPIVTSAVAMVSSLGFSATGTWYTPAQVRSALISTGAGQLNGFNPATQNIGPRPNVIAAVNQLVPSATILNDACGSAAVLSGASGSVVGRVLGAGNDGTATCGSSASNGDVWYRFTAPNYPGTFVASTCGTHDWAGCVDCGMDTVVSLLATCGGTQLDCNDDDSTNSFGCAVSGFNRDSTVSAALTSGQSVLVRVSKFSTVASNGFVLNWRYVPANDSCANAITVTSTPFISNGSLVNATNDGTADCGGSVGNPDVWYSFTACADGVLAVSTCGTHDTGGVDTGMDTVVSIHSACGGASVVCNDDDPVNACSGDAGSRRDSYLSYAMSAGQQVYIRISKFSSGIVGPFNVQIVFGVNNDTCSLAQNTGSGTITFNNACANTDGFAENLCLNAGNSQIYRDVWYRWTAPSLGFVEINTCSSGPDTRLAVYNACPAFANSGNLLACNDDACGAPFGFQSRIVLRVTAGSPYYIRAGTFNDFGGGLITMSIFCPADWNRSGSVSVQDIFDFLAAWFSNMGDFNGVGGTSVQDIFDFLAAWFAGCPA